ncbi:dethiobiotin synthase [Ectothiorhodospira mobilis]|uniref:dethiobiotin synthase n=1 Tax=Ectothiorhodospira mobilis TaxID=195064 RepID=UPI001A92A2D3|nr:dethiobiotin synthase [Ectothiorhodospira mobilis]
MTLPGLFITGTDTGVGKTVAGCVLIRGLRARGCSVLPRKPVESGCARRGGVLWPADGARLLEAAGRDELDRVTPWRFPHALAPDRAARLAGTPLHLDALASACRPVASDDLVLVEGAGGFYSPLAEGALNADLAGALGFPLILVAPDRLGVLNPILLTAEAALRRGLTLAGVVLNDPGEPGPEGMDNAADLQARLQVPLLRLGRTHPDRPQPPPDMDAWLEQILNRRSAP